MASIPSNLAFNVVDFPFASLISPLIPSTFVSSLVIFPSALFATTDIPSILAFNDAESPFAFLISVSTPSIVVESVVILPSDAATFCSILLAVWLNSDFIDSMISSESSGAGIHELSIIPSERKPSYK